MSIKIRNKNGEWVVDQRALDTSIVDLNNNFESTNVEGALRELSDRISDDAKSGLTEEEKKMLDDIPLLMDTKFDDVVSYIDETGEYNVIDFYANGQIIKSIKTLNPPNSSGGNSGGVSGEGGSLSEEDRELLNNIPNIIDSKIDNVELIEDGTNNVINFYANGKIVSSISFLKASVTINPGVLMTSYPTNSTVKTTENVVIPYTFDTENHGNATLYVTIACGEKIKELTYTITKVGMGTVNLGILDKGVNQISMYVIDAMAKKTNMLYLQVVCGALEISSTFDDKQDFSNYSSITIPVTVGALDKSDMTLTVNIDGNIFTQQVVNGYNSYTYPSLFKTVGVHNVTMQVSTDAFSSNVLEFKVIIASNEEVLLSTNTTNVTFEEGYNVSVPYRISMMGQSLFNVEYYVNEELVNTLQAQIGDNTYVGSYRDYPIGNYILKIKATTIDGQFTKTLVINVNIIKNLFPRIEHAKVGLQAYFDMSVKSNSDTNKEVLESLVLTDNGKRAKLVLHDYNFNTNGWIDGRLVSNGTAWAEMIDYLPLEGNVEGGFTFDILFNGRNMGDADNRILDCTGDDYPYPGFFIDSEKAVVATESNKLTNVYTDNKDTRVTFVLNRTSTFLDKWAEDENGFLVELETPVRKNNPMVQVFIDGLFTEAGMLSDSGSGANKIFESIAHANRLLINTDKNRSAFGVSSIKSIRIYNRPLSHEEVLQNKMADIDDLMEQKTMYDKNYVTVNQDIPVLYINDTDIGTWANTTKDTKQWLNIVYNSPNAEKFGESFDLIGQTAWQGTSSLAYPIKNIKFKLYEYETDEVGNPINMDNPDTFTKKKIDLYGARDGDGFKENTFTVKVDYMESAHARNTGTARFTSDILFKGNPNPAKQKDSKTRDAINGTPCLIYINGERIGLGNLNHDKSCTKTLGMETIPNTVRWEIKANTDTSEGAFFKTWEEGNVQSIYDKILTDFEIVYDEDAFEENSGDFDLTKYYDELHLPYKGTSVRGGYRDYAILSLARYVQFVSETDDKEEFRQKAPEYFNVDRACRYYLNVMTFGMIDNFAKNCIINMYGDDIWWYSFYDCDSSLGLDNTGYMKFESDIEPSQPNVYNCSTSKMWVKLNEFFQPELFNNFKTLRESDYTYEKVCEYLIESQIDQIADILYNEDMYSKYISQGRRYLHMLHGNNKAHLLRWLYNRFLYVDSLFLQHNSPYTKQAITIRSCKPTVVPDDLPENVQYIPKFEIETYTPQYVTICWRKNTYETKRVGKGERVIFENPMTNSQDNELIVYCANNLKRIGDCTDKNPTSIDIGSATRLVEFKCENSTELLKADLSNNKYLKTISFRNCTNLGNTTGGANVLDVSGCTNLRYLDIYNTSITSVLTNVDGGNLEEIYYPTGIQNIVVRNQTNLKVLGVPYGIPTKVMPTEFVEGKSVDDLGNIIDSPSTEERTFFVTTKLIGTSKLENCSIYLRGLSINETYFNLKSYCYFYDDNGNYLGVRHLANRYYTDAHKPHNDYVSTIDYKTQMISSEDYPDARYCRLRLESTLATGTRLLYQNILNRCLVVDSFDNTVFTHHECDKLTTLDILNCNNIEMLNYRGGKDFTAFKHTKNLSLQNSLRAEDLNLEGFNNLKTLSIRDMLVLKNLSFAGMTGETDDSNLTSAVIANCPNLTRLLLAENVDTKFGQGGVLDLRNTSLVSIESLNACIKGLKSIYLPRSIKDLIFTYKGETGEISDIENIWSYDSVEKNMEDGYEGIDLEGAEIRDIVLETVVKSPTIRIDDGSRPVNSFVVNSTLRDGVTYPYIKLLGTLNLSEYIGLLTDLFARCDITELNIISNKNLTKTDASRLFNYTIIGDCDLSNILSRTTSLTNCSNMFQSCVTNGEIKGLDRLDVSKVTNMSCMFYGCTSLTSVPITEIPDSVTDINNLFNGCTNLKDISGMTFGKGITTATDWIPPNLETANNVTIKNDAVNFAECGTLKYANNFTFDSRNASRIFNKTGVIQVNNLVITNKCLTVGSPSSGIGLFSGCSDLESIDFANCDLSNVTDMRNLCSHTPKLKHVYNLKTSGKLQYFGLAFYGCSKLTTISGISDWNVSNVMDMNNMFCNCSSLTSLDVSDWNVSSVTNMYNMFYNCSSLTSLDVSDWNVSSVTNMNSMFYNCTSLTSVPIIEIPDSVTDISGLFNGCTNIKDISGMTFGRGITTATDWMPPNLETANNVTIKNNFVSFNGCATLKYCNNLRSYYTKTFNNCKNLIEINNLLLLGEDGKEVKGGGISLFRKNANLEKITFSPDCNCTISSFSFTFLENPKLKEIDFGGGVRVNFAEQGYIIGQNETPNIESIKNLKVLSAGSTARLAGYGESNFLNKLNYLDCTIYDNSASKLFKRQGIRDISNIKFDKSVTNLSEAFMDNLLLESDIIIPSHVTDCSNMFKGCTAMTHVHSNWNNEYDEDIITTDCYNGCTAISNIDGTDLTLNEYTTGLDQVPEEWGGYDFIRDYTGIYKVIIPNDNYDYVTYSTVSSANSYVPYKQVINWGDGTITKGEFTHTYSKGGTYIIKGHYYCGGNGSCTDSAKACLNEVIQFPRKPMDYYEGGYKWNGNTGAFSFCTKLVKANISGCEFVNDSKAIFNGCTNLTTVIADNLDFSRASYISQFFTNCSNLTTISGISSWDVSKIKGVSQIFQNCSSLTSLNIGEWDVSSVIEIAYMFYGCSSLTSLDIGRWSMPNVTNTTSMFQSCSSLTSLDLSGWNISNVNYADSMFSNCTSLTSINGIESWDTSKLQRFSYMFNYCRNLKFNFVNGKPNWTFNANTHYMHTFMQGCGGDLPLGENEDYIIDLSDCGTIKVAQAFSLFRGSGFTKISINIDVTAEDNRMTFDSCANLRELVVSGHWGGDIRDFATNCPKLTTVDLSNLDMGDIMEGRANSMFGGNSTALTNLKFGINFNASLNLSSSVNLTVESLMSVINNIADLTGGDTKTLNLGATNLAKLTPEQIAIATNKNWTVI